MVAASSDSRRSAGIFGIIVMEQDLLTPDQKKVIAMVAGEPRLARFYLTGGTALAAYYLRHRISDDLDFFIFEEPDVLLLREVAEQMRRELGGAEVRFERLYDRYQYFFACASGELKIEFTRYPFQQLEEPLMHDGIQVDSMRDIAANKLMALLDRFDPKDFADLYFLMQERPLEEMRKDVEQKFKMKVGSLFLGGELMKVRRIEAFPKMILPLEVETVKDFFIARGRELAPEIFR